MPFLLQLKEKEEEMALKRIAEVREGHQAAQGKRARGRGMLWVAGARQGMAGSGWCTRATQGTGSLNDGQQATQARRYSGGTRNGKAGRLHGRGSWPGVRRRGAADAAPRCVPSPLQTVALAS